MTMETSAALLVAMIISAAAPGPGVFACISKALASGYRASILLICRIVAGNIVFFILAMLGLSAMVRLWGDLFVVIKWAGGAYLVWLGWKMVRTAPTPLDLASRMTAEMRVSDFFAGLFVPFSNPKVILFYVSLLPSFIDLSALSYLDGLTAACLITFALFGVLSAYAVLASRTRRIFASRRAVRNLNRGAGITMMGTGVIIASRSN